MATKISSWKSSPTVKKPEYKVMLGIPSLGHYQCDMALSLITCSKNHMVDVQKASSNWDNFSILWAMALNANEAGLITHFAMLHDDIIPTQWWLDVLIDEMERMKVPLISVPVPIKDHQGITSSGIGQTADPYRVWRRLTLWELYHTSLPDTFTFDDIVRCIPGKLPEGDNKPYIVHNNGLWVADLRDPRWHKTAADGNAACYFQFPKRMFRANVDGREIGNGEYTEATDDTPIKTSWMVAGESEDWFFSRRLHDCGIPSAITTKVKLGHDGGSVRWTNEDGWGAMEHDENTKGNWGIDEEKFILNCLDGTTMDMKQYPSLAPRIANENAYLQLIIDQFNDPGYRELPIKGTVLDLGANCGMFSALVSPVVDRVVAVEPSPRNYPALTRFIEEAGLKNVTPIRAAVWTSNGTVPLVQDDNITSDHISFDNDGLPKEEVPCLTLKELMDSNGLDRANFIKMDIEGAEDHVLSNGSFADVAGRIDSIWVECHCFREEHMADKIDRVEGVLKQHFAVTQRIGSPRNGEAVVFASEPLIKA